MSKLCTRINSILKDLKSGKTTKSNELFEATYNHLKVIAWIYAEDKNDCEDIVQESILRALKYIHSANLKKDGYNWLCKIVQNVAYDFSSDKKSPIEAEKMSFDAMEDTLVEQNALNYEIAQLSQQDQQMIYLRFWRDMTYRDIEKELHVSKSAVQKRMIELLEKLKEKLN